MKTQTGFTLIELIIVMVIVGLLAAVASPKFFDFQSTARTNTSMHLKGSINDAMALAFSNHRLQNLTQSGALPGTTQYITNCDSLIPYLDGGLPAGVTCATGTRSLVFTDTTQNVTFTAETNFSRALAP